VPKPILVAKSKSSSQEGAGPFEDKKSEISALSVETSDAKRAARHKKSPQNSSA